MGVIVIDGSTTLKFKGSIAKFEKAIVALSKFEKQIKGLRIETIPLPEVAGMCLRLKFKGPLSEFEKANVGLEKLRASVAIDTVPLPESPAIGTWPTPEKPSTSLSWIINVSSKTKRRSKK